MKSVLLAASYAVIGLLTFGQHYHSYSNSRTECSGDSGVYVTFHGPDIRILSSALSGAFWPLYWAGRAAIEVTK